LVSNFVSQRIIVLFSLKNFSLEFFHWKKKKYKSKDPLAKVYPSAEYYTEVTLCKWSESLLILRPVAGSQIYTKLIFVKEKIKFIKIMN